MNTKNFEDLERRAHALAARAEAAEARADHLNILIYLVAGLYVLLTTLIALTTYIAVTQ